MKFNYIKFLTLVFVIVVGVGMILWLQTKNPFGLKFNLSLLLFGLSVGLFFCYLGFCLVKKKLIFKVIGALSLVLAVIFLLLPMILIVNPMIFMPNDHQLTHQQWTSDIEQLKELIRERHDDSDLLYPKDKLERDIQTLKESLADSSGDNIKFDIVKIVASMEVSHSQVSIFQPKILKYLLPLKTYFFDDGLFITDTYGKYKQFIGAEIIGINDLDIQSVFERLSEYMAGETIGGEKSIFPYYLINPDLLKHDKIITSIDDIRIKIKTRNGAIKSLNYPAYPSLQVFLWLMRNPSDRKAKQPVGFQFFNVDYYWYQSLDDETLYVNYGLVREKEKQDMQTFVEVLSQYISRNPKSKMILDIRNNTGGNYMTYSMFTDFIEKNFCEYGNLRILSSYKSASACNNLIRELRQTCDPIVFGQPIFEGASFYADPRDFTLENSGITVSLSSHNSYLYDFEEFALDTARITNPEIHIPYLSKNYFGNNDVTLQTALAFKTKHEKYQKGINIGKKRFLLNPYRVVELNQETDHSIRMRIHDFTRDGIFKEPRNRQSHSLFYIDKKLFWQDSLYSSIDGIFEYIPNKDYPSIYYSGQEVLLQELTDDYIFPVQFAVSEDIDDAIDAMAKYPDRIPKALEQNFNNIGYSFLRKNNPDAALPFFKLNLELFPSSWNVYDSYAECLLILNRKEEAIEYYEKALGLNPGDARITGILKKIKS